jgi:VanZ family protein
MNNYFSKHKIFFYLSNFILIVLYLYPGSLLGCLFYSDCKLQLQFTSDFMISSNHFYSFFILSIIGLFTYKNQKKFNFLTSYLISLSIFLEILHVFVPNRSFEFPDLFGNLFGVLVVLIIYLFFKKYEKFKN